MSNIIIEAEKMTLDGYRLESNPIASGGELISLSGGEATEIGTASFEFAGTEGYYEVVLGYFDEKDGASRLAITHPSGTTNLQLDQQLGNNVADEQTKTSKTIATELWVNSGDLFTISGIEDRGEYARLDYIEFIHIDSSNLEHTFIDQTGNDTFNDGSGNDSVDYSQDSVDYSQAVKGIIANLNEGKVLKPIFGTMEQPKLMAIGDSITAGEHQVEPIPGAYRINLWDNFVADGLNVDFVGSQSNGPTNMDPNHEGHPGWTIDEISALVDTLVDNGLLATYRPDVVKLMIGTNDILHGDPTSTLETELSQLIDRITGELPNAHLLVSSIAPLEPAKRGNGRANIVEEYNELIPVLVEEKADQGQKITYVNGGGSLSLNDLVSDGIHPNAPGYDKLGDAFYNALVERDSLSGIANIKGTAFRDRLTGDINNNMLTGSVGADTMAGGGGADSFIYNNPTEGFDSIADFDMYDSFVISASGFGGGLVEGVNLSTTASATGVFVSSPTPISLGSSANFLYENDTGTLRFDPDGDGGITASTIAILSNLHNLSGEQFTIVA